MPVYLEIPVGECEVLLVEVASQDMGLTPAARGDVRDRLTEPLSRSLGRVRTFAGQVLEQLTSAAQPPDKVSIEFGLKLTAKAGLSSRTAVSTARRWSPTPRAAPACA